LKEKLTKYRIGIAAIQEIGWPGTEIMDRDNGHRRIYNFVQWKYEEYIRYRFCSE